MKTLKRIANALERIAASMEHQELKNRIGVWKKQKEETIPTTPSPKIKRWDLWRKEEDEILIALRANNVPFRIISKTIKTKLGTQRTTGACSARFMQLRQNKQL